MEKRVDLRLKKKKERTSEKWRGKKKNGEKENSEGVHGESNGERGLRVETSIGETTKLQFWRVKVGIWGSISDLYLGGRTRLPQIATRFSNFPFFFFFFFFF